MRSKENELESRRPSTTFRSFLVSPLSWFWTATVGPLLAKGLSALRVPAAEETFAESESSVGDAAERNRHASKRQQSTQRSTDEKWRWRRRRAHRLKDGL